MKSSFNCSTRKTMSVTWSPTLSHIVSKVRMPSRRYSTFGSIWATLCMPTLEDEVVHRQQVIFPRGVEHEEHEPSLLHAANFRAVEVFDLAGDPTLEWLTREQGKVFELQLALQIVVQPSDERSQRVARTGGFAGRRIRIVGRVEDPLDARLRVGKGGVGLRLKLPAAVDERVANFVALFVLQVFKLLTWNRSCGPSDNPVAIDVPLGRIAPRVACAKKWHEPGQHLDTRLPFLGTRRRLAPKSVS